MASGKKALIVGINEYGTDIHRLAGCVNDAKKMAEILSKNWDGTANFCVKSLFDSQATNANVERAMGDLFRTESDVALFYFSGHGFDDERDGGIVCSNSSRGDIRSIRMLDIMSFVNRSKAKSKVVILDCCYAGNMGNDPIIGDKTVLDNDTIIMTACSPEEPAVEYEGSGIFTSLFAEALDGMAADILGRVTPAAVYNHIDRMLSDWEQRPYFKANVSSFITLRTAKPRIGKSRLMEGLALFKTPYSGLALDPSFECTNVEGGKNEENKPPYANAENVSSFQLLQEMVAAGLVAPVGEKHMYYAAMHSKSCSLTDLGKTYKLLAKKELLQ